jgi:hypothetical protein
MSEQTKTPEQIEDEIRATQKRIDAEIDAIQAQFQPAAIFSRLVGEAETGRGNGGANGPLGPASLRAALIGAGISWLAQNAFAAVNSPQVRNTARGATLKAKKTATEASQAGAEAGEAALEAISDAAEQIREGGLRGIEWIKNNPIPSSLAGFAVGAAIAAVVSAAIEETDHGAAKTGKAAAKKSAKGNGRTRKTATRKPAKRARKTSARTSRAKKTASARTASPAAKTDQRHAS